MYYSTFYPPRRSYYGPSPVIPFAIIVGLLLVIFWEPLCDWQVYAYEVKESIGSNVLIISFVTVVAFMFLLGLITDALVIIVPLAVLVVVILPFLNKITVVLVLLVLIAFLGTHYYPTQKFVSYDRGRLHPGTSWSWDRNNTYLGFGLSSSFLYYVVMLASLFICITYYEDEASRWICLALILIAVLFFNFTGFGDDRSGYQVNKTGLNSWNWNWNWLRSPYQYRNTGTWHGSGTNSGLMSLSFGLLGYLAMVVCIFFCMMFCNINVTWCYTMAFVLLIALYFNYNEPEIKRYRLY